MAYDVTKTNGERLAIVPDRQIDTTTSIKLLGKNFPSYGEIMAENLVAMLEHFSNPQAPQSPIIGQLWYKTTENILYVNADGTNNGWYPLGGKEVIGGPATAFETSAIKDENGFFHPAIKVKVNYVYVAIISSDTSAYRPHPVDEVAIATNFPLIGQGINMNMSGNDDDGDGESGNYKLRGRSIEAEFADMAEIYVADGYLQAGNLVRLGGNNEITKTVAPFDSQVFGVISTAPGFLLNSKMKRAEFAYPVALKGRVPCLVTGKVNKGQRIVASDIPGVGMATDHFDPATIIGRAISDKHDNDLGTVEVAIGVR
jgi:hypothetical protein